MIPQVSKEKFIQALSELGHNPDDFRGKRLSLQGMSSLYSMDQESIIDAIDQKYIGAHYDYLNDTIWVDALEAAHFYYCVMASSEIFNN